jgi:spore maturation protein CgeB
MTVFILGYNQPGQMGRYLLTAATTIGLRAQILDMDKAETHIRLFQRFRYLFCDKRPAYMSDFAAQVLLSCANVKPSALITTGGRVPLERTHIEKIQSMGVKVLNYSTDDPWNPKLYAPWFVESLPAYDVVFTPRRANFEEFKSCGVRHLNYLAFAYDPKVHYPWLSAEQSGAKFDVLFVGACDRERLPLIEALIEAGLSLALFGRYWERNPKTREYARGIASQDAIRAASASASICLCLVRRENRDGHVMRSFEAAAIGGCVLAEDTEDHRDLFGAQGAAQFFNTVPQLVMEAKRLAADSFERLRMASKLRERMARRADTYADRLSEMLSQAKVERDSARNS